MTCERLTRPLLTVLLGAALLLASGCARLPEPGRLAEGAASIEVPTKFRGGHVLVATGLGEADSVWLLLDSGAQLILLHRGVAEELGRPLVGTSRITGYGEATVEGRVVVDLPIRVAGADPFTLTLPVVDLEPLHRHAGFPLAGFLGAPLFHRFVVEIDYERQRVVLHDPDSFRPPADDIRLPLDVEQGTPHVDAVIELDDGSRIRDRFVVDTGLRGAISLAAPFVTEHGLLTRLHRTIPQRVAGVGGAIEERLGRLVALHLGPLRIEGATAQLSTATSGAGAAEGRAGAIGAELLRRFTVTLDFRDETMYLRPNASYAEPFEADMSGASFIVAGDDLSTLVVHDIEAGSPAARAALAVGDTLLEIDGRPARGVRLWQLRDLLRAPAGRTIPLVVRRGEEVLELRLTLERRI